MNLQAIIIANLTGFFLIFFLYMSRFITKTKGDTEEHAFEVMMALAAIACLVEPLTFAVDGVPGKISYWVNILGNTYLYYANGLGSFLWLLYLDLSLNHDRSRMKKNLLQNMHSGDCTSSGINRKYLVPLLLLCR